MTVTCSYKTCFNFFMCLLLQKQNTVLNKLEKANGDCCYDHVLCDIAVCYNMLELICGACWLSE